MKKRKSTQMENSLKCMEILKKFNEKSTMLENTVKEPEKDDLGSMDCDICGHEMNRGAKDLVMDYKNFPILVRKHKGWFCTNCTNYAMNQEDMSEAKSRIKQAQDEFNKTGFAKDFMGPIREVQKYAKRLGLTVTLKKDLMLVVKNPGMLVKELFLSSHIGEVEAFLLGFEYAQAE